MPENNDERGGLPSASGYERIEACPGSFQLEATMPEEAQDPLADRGTRIHRAFETGDTSGLSEDEIADYEQGLKHLDLLLAKWQRDYALDVVEELPRETRLWLHDPTTLDPIGSGKMDRWFRSADRSLVVDLKSGWATHVPASPRNPQMRFYALLVWAELGIGNIRVAIDRAKSRAGADDYVDYTASDLRYAEHLLLTHLWAAHQPNAPRYPGRHCFYCRGKSACPEAACFSLLPGVLAQRAAPELRKPEEQVALLCDADLLKIWNADTIIRKVLDAVDARLKTFPKERLAQLGLELPGKGAKNNSIEKTLECFQYLRDIQQIPEEALWAALELRLGKVRDIIKESRNLTDKMASGWCEEKLAEFIRFDNKAPSLRKLKL